jgi:sulfate adenylyltransferase subunit 2
MNDIAADFRQAIAAAPPSLPQHLAELESEAIAILRITAAETRNPVLLYSAGKDSTVLLHLAQRAFHPAPIPFAMLHIDTGWKFPVMLAFRDAEAARVGIRLVVHTNPDGAAQAINPFDHADSYTHIMKTLALRQALAAGGHDAAIGGARRDEERSRAKERIFSRRGATGGWDPRQQRPEFGLLANLRLSPGESLRVFPLSNWSERDVWEYVLARNLLVAPLYFAAERPVVERGGHLIVAADARMRLLPGEIPRMRMVRFRTLGCYPLTAAHFSTAVDLPAVVAEILGTRLSERAGRLIDHGTADTMEHKKREGYF